MQINFSFLNLLLKLPKKFLTPRVLSLGLVFFVIDSFPIAPVLLAVGGVVIFVFLVMLFRAPFFDVNIDLGVLKGHFSTHPPRAPSSQITKYWE
ncbi:MAG: hypothetical protein KC643_30205 [Nitrospira sp.]|nr:hypothetical protein [Nitrospira sp.]